MEVVSPEIGQPDEGTAFSDNRYVSIGQKFHDTEPSRTELGGYVFDSFMSILLLEDLAIVPLLAIVAFLAPGSAEANAHSRWVDIGIALAALAGLIAAGRWLLNPMFQLLAAAEARAVLGADVIVRPVAAARGEDRFRREEVVSLHEVVAEE